MFNCQMSKQRTWWMGHPLIGGLEPKFAFGFEPLVLVGRVGGK